MDIGELFEEHKRWILGCALGLLVYLIGWFAVIPGVYSTDELSSQRLRLVRSNRSQETYTPAALASAREEQEQLDDELTRLREALEFHVPPRFLLEGRSESYDQHFSRVQSELLRELLDRADNLNVDLARRDLVWPLAVGEEVPSVLLGMALLDQAVNRLLDAHDRVMGENPEALGLRRIESFSVDGNVALSRRFRGPRRGFDPQEYLRQETVSFSFRADTATTMFFLESCRDPSPLSLVELSLHQGQPGEALQVKGKLAVFVFRELD